MLQFKNIPRKICLWVWIGQVLFTYGWFIYIYGVLGHVCPVAFLGMWNASLIGSIAVFGKRPSFIGTFLSLIITAVSFALAYFVFHPFDEDHLTRYINVAPFIILGITSILSVLAHVIGIKISEKASKVWELKIERTIEYFFVILLTIAGIAYMCIPSIKESMYIDPPDVTEWFDTLFYMYDVYNLFYFLVIQALICNVCIIIGFYFDRLKTQNSPRSLICKVLGFSFLGYLLVGTWATFHLFGLESPETSNE
jgi:hypothetical protein